MIEVAFANNLPAIDMARELQHELRIAGTSKPVSDLVAVKRLTARATSLTESAKRWEATLLPRIIHAKGRELRGSVRQAREAIEELRGHLDRVLARLNDAEHPQHRQ